MPLKNKLEKEINQLSEAKELIQKEEKEGKEEEEKKKLTKNEPKKQLSAKKSNKPEDNETNPLKRSCSKLKVSFFPPLLFLFLATLCSVWDSSTPARD